MSRSAYVLATQLLAAVLLVACAGSGGYQPRAEVALLDIRPRPAQDGEPRYGLTLGIQNPGAVQLPLAGLSWRIAIDGREFAWGVSRQAVIVPAHSEAVLELEVAGGAADALRTDRGAYRLHYDLTGELGLADSAARLPFGTSGALDWRPADVQQQGAR
ncbi:MAG: LEA type 2 family protein [Pseudomonadota bacterium]